MKRSFFLTIFLGVGCCAAPVRAAEASTNAVSIDVLVTTILERNPELKFYEAEIAAAKGERRAAAALPNPELTTQLGHKTVRDRGANSDGAAWSVSLQQPFEWPGRIALRKTIANQQIILAELGLAQFRTALAARAKTLAYTLFVAREKAAAAREVADRFQALREVLVQRDPAGLTPLLETRVIEATEISLQRQASEAAVEAAVAFQELNQLCGEARERIHHVTPGIITFTNVPDTDLLLAAARTNNFELRMREAEFRQQGFRISLARNERYPTISVGPYVSQERADERETQIGVGFTMPLPLWNNGKGSLEIAHAREQQAQTSLHVAIREIERRIGEQSTRYSAKLTEMSKWRPDSIEKFREAASLADRHYRLGAVPISTYVELQKQYLEAVTALLETKREALDSRQQLELLTGLNFSSIKP